MKHSSFQPRKSGYAVKLSVVFKEKILFLRSSKLQFRQKRRSAPETYSLCAANEKRHPAEFVGESVIVFTLDQMASTIKMYNLNVKKG